MLGSSDKLMTVFESTVQSAILMAEAMTRKDLLKAFQIVSGLSEKIVQHLFQFTEDAEVPLNLVEPPRSDHSSGYYSVMQSGTEPLNCSFIGDNTRTPTTHSAASKMCDDVAIYPVDLRDLRHKPMGSQQNGAMETHFNEGSSVFALNNAPQHVYPPDAITKRITLLPEAYTTWLSTLCLSLVENSTAEKVSAELGSQQEALTNQLSSTTANSVAMTVGQNTSYAYPTGLIPLLFGNRLPILVSYQPTVPDVASIVSRVGSPSTIATSEADDKIKTNASQIDFQSPIDEQQSRKLWPAHHSSTDRVYKQILPKPGDQSIFINNPVAQDLSLSNTKEPCVGSSNPISTVAVPPTNVTSFPDRNNQMDSKCPFEPTISGQSNAEHSQLACQSNVSSSSHNAKSPGILSIDTPHPVTVVTKRQERRARKRSQSKLGERPSVSKLSSNESSIKRSHKFSSSLTAAPGTGVVKSSRYNSTRRLSATLRLVSSRKSSRLVSTLTPTTAVSIASTSILSPHCPSTSSLHSENVSYPTAITAAPPSAISQGSITTGQVVASISSLKPIQPNRSIMTAKPLPPAPIVSLKKTGECAQACSKCNIIFPTAVAFIEHIQQVHIGLTPHQIKRMNSNQDPSARLIAPSPKDGENINPAISTWQKEEPGQPLIDIIHITDQTALMPTNANTAINMCLSIPPTNPISQLTHTVGLATPSSSQSLPGPSSSTPVSYLPNRLIKQEQPEGAMGDRRFTTSTSPSGLRSPTQSIYPTTANGQTECISTEKVLDFERNIGDLGLFFSWIVVCPACGRRLTTISSFRRHFAATHSRLDLMSPSFICKRCGFRAEEPSQLDAHTDRCPAYNQDRHRAQSKTELVATTPPTHQSSLSGSELLNNQILKPRTITPVK